MRYFVKVTFQTFNLLWTILIRTQKPSHVLMQTPPSIPTLFVAVLVCYLRSSRLIVDYHNYGHTILALSLGRKHPLVKFSEIYEKWLSLFAHSNICVSEAMRTDLLTGMGISTTVFHDRPPGRFKPATLSQKHELFVKLSADNAVFRCDVNDIDESTTVFTELRAGEVVMKNDRPFLLVSSTSWTVDEDFSILLDALEEYNTAADAANILPNVLCVITGKGPLLKYYEKIIQAKDLSHVNICTLWLSAEDYPVLLGSADLGVCLHKSSSGLDLPMKVVDMFGCGLPVCAVNFDCLHELVTHGYNGMVFSQSSELSLQIQSLSHGFPDKSDRLTQYKENLSAFQSLRWDHYWKLQVLPLIKEK
jgi:beta-1,4-mannosyltransferase